MQDGTHSARDGHAAIFFCYSLCFPFGCNMFWKWSFKMHFTPDRNLQQFFSKCVVQIVRTSIGNLGQGKMVRN